jgi:hypothetical protein
VLSGRFAIVRFFFAACCAERTFRFAASICFRVAISSPPHPPTRRLWKHSLVLAVGWLALAAPAAAGPRDEKERLTKAGQALARHAVLHRSDLSGGWRPVSVPARSYRCRSYDPDLSRFTLNGKAHSAFVLQTGAAIGSSVGVYVTAGQAAAAFAAQARPGLLTCMSTGIVKQFARAGIKASVVAKRMSRGPRVGARSASFRIVLMLSVGGGTAPYDVDLVTFQTHRSIAALSFQALGGPVPRQLALVRRVASRL